MGDRPCCGGDTGPAIVAGKAAESLLIQAVTGTTDLVSKMPPEGEPLTDAQVALLRRWIDSGAKAPAEQLAADSKGKHWSFQRPVRTPLPPVPTPAGSTTQVRFGGDGRDYYINIVPSDGGDSLKEGKPLTDAAYLPKV